MHKKESALEQLLKQKMLPLYYHPSLEVSVQILKALYAAGVRMVEYTNRGEGALGNFRELKRAAAGSMPELLLGIGTIKTARQAEDFLAAGADFVVSPVVSKAVAEQIHQAGLLWIPGCMTPTEINEAEEAGATLVKLFPGNLLGPAYVTAVRELFPGLKFMPTGGVEAEETNLKAWFGAGVTAVGMGSKLIQSSWIAQGDFAALEEAVRTVLVLVHRAAQPAGTSVQ